jgi:hypothetical protein
MISKTEDDEKEYWVSDNDLQAACDEGIEYLAKHRGESV